MRHAQAGAVKTAVRSALILCAAAVCILRFVSFRYEASLPQGTRRALFAVCVICAAACVLCAVVWVILEKKEKNGT